MTDHDSWNTVKSMFKETCIDLHAYIRKRKWLNQQINFISQEERVWKKIIKMKTGMNVILKVM